jgi:hypothetical protein
MPEQDLHATEAHRAEGVLDVVLPADHQPDEGDGANVLAHNAAFYAELPLNPRNSPKQGEPSIRSRM